MLTTAARFKQRLHMEFQDPAKPPPCVLAGSCQATTLWPCSVLLPLSWGMGVGRLMTRAAAHAAAQPDGSARVVAPAFDKCRGYYWLHPVLLSCLITFQAVQRPSIPF